MRRSPPLLFAAVIGLFAAFTVSAAAQAPGSSPNVPRTFPAPTNLKVLPKNLSGQQVRDIMENWQGSLGVHCSNCHAEDPKNIGQNGRPRLNFADDSKPQKATARLMYTMMEEINKSYVSKIPNSDAMVSCGTCHRGKLDPEDFVLPKEEHGGPPASEPPTETHPPSSR